MTEIDYAQRVARGAALMDEKWPTWKDDVELDRLDIADPQACMTAQFAQITRQDSDLNYSHGKEALGLDDKSYAAYGFNADPREVRGGYDAKHDHYQAGINTLNTLWRDLIVQHRYSPDPRPEADVA